MDRSTLDFAYGGHFCNGAIVMFFVIASPGDPLTGPELFVNAAFSNLVGGFPWLGVLLLLSAASIVCFTLINLSCRRLLVLGALLIGIPVSALFATTVVSFLFGTYGVLSLYFSIHWFFFVRKKTPT